MNILVINAGKTLDGQFIADHIHYKYVKNMMPSNADSDNFIEYECGSNSTIDWSKIDYSIMVGTCNVGRHKMDLQLSDTEETNDKIVQTIESNSDYMTEAGID